jgi:hypothetical protein
MPPCLPQRQWQPPSSSKGATSRFKGASCPSKGATNCSSKEPAVDLPREGLLRPQGSLPLRPPPGNPPKEQDQPQAFFYLPESGSPPASASSSPRRPVRFKTNRQMLNPEGRTDIDLHPLTATARNPHAADSPPTTLPQLHDLGCQHWMPQTACTASKLSTQTHPPV